MDVEGFWKRIKLRLNAQKISQKKFSEYINVPYGTFNNWLYYRRSIDVVTAYRIATALGVTVEYLVTGNENKTYS